jgi:hypothetical protein
MTASDVATASRCDHSGYAPQPDAVTPPRFRHDMRLEFPKKWQQDTCQKNICQKLCAFGDSKTLFERPPMLGDPTPSD